MDNGFLTEQVKLIKVADPATAATSAVNGTGVDMRGWDGVLFFTSYGTAAADNVLKAQQSDDDASADDYSDLEGSKVVAGASDEDQYLDIQLPIKRYVRPVALRGTSSTCGDIWAILYKGRSAPVSSIVSGTITGKQLYHPAEGTA